jgi:dihydroorotate dehydrogenase electron transfer subunit
MGQQGSVELVKIIEENSKVRTLLFEIPHPDLKFQAGQFLMVWIPSIDEIPMSISSWKKPTMGITVLPVGEATQVLADLKKNQLVGIRGPFGTGFKLTTKKSLVIGGGIGIAPLRPLVLHLLKQGTDVTLIAAAKSAKDLVFVDEFKKITNSRFNLRIATDDGSMGFKGLATEDAEEFLAENKVDTIYTCGPELMMAKLFSIAKEKNVGFQASLERFMKCGCGICGTCAMDPNGELVCVDGPVFTGEQLTTMSEFGRYHRDSTGIKKEF